MKRILFLFLFLALTGIASAQSNPPLTVQEADGSPKKTGVTKIVVSNGTLTISGTTATITTGGGGGGGLTVGTTTIASGTAGRLLYEAAGNVLGEISGVTSNGSSLTALPVAGVITQTSTSATAFESGPNGGTNPVFRLVNSTASSATGLSITGNAAGSGVTLTALSSGSTESIRLVPKGTGQVIVPDGSASAPAIALSSFLTTGLYTSGATDVSFAAGGVRAAFISSNFMQIDSGRLVLLSDLTLRRAAAANLAFGAADAASPVAQTLSVQNVVGGTTNTAGASFTIANSRGTGTGTGGDFIVQTAPAGGSGTTQNALAAAFTVKGNGAVELKTVTFANLPTVANAYLIYCSDCTIASPCASGGSGALAKGINGQWVCN